MPAENDGVMIILSSPSGAGKTTLVSLLAKLNNFEVFISRLKNKKIIIDNISCSLYYENFFKKKAKVFLKEDPVYLLKSIKNKTEINNMINSHIFDGVALKRFLYWIKNIKKKKITEFEAQKKLEIFRKKNKNYLFPSFNTIAGTGSNGAIIHYRAKKNNTKHFTR